MTIQIDQKLGEEHPTLKLGVIGCGKHCVQSHITKIREDIGTSFTAVFDPSPNSIAELQSAILGNPRIFQTEEELLLSPVPAVLIMSPDDFHAETLLHAVRAGKHVFVEKPLAVNSEQLNSVRDAMNQANTNNLIISSCHPRRFDPPFLWLKNNLPDLINELGEVSHFEFDFSYHKPSKAWKNERGLLLDHINHEIDLVHWYFGHQPFTAWKLVDQPDHYHVVGMREDSIHFSFNGSRQLDSKVYREFVRIRFQRGTLLLDTNTGEINIHNHNLDTNINLKIPGIDYEKRFRLVNQNFIDAIRGDSQSYLSLKDLYVNTALSVKLTEQDYWRYMGEDR